MSLLRQLGIQKSSIIPECVQFRNLRDSALRQKEASLIEVIYASACNAGDAGDLGPIPGWGRSPGEGNGNPLQLFLPEEFHGQRSLAGYSLWGHKEWEKTEWRERCFQE